MTNAAVSKVDVLLTIWIFRWRSIHIVSGMSGMLNAVWRWFAINTFILVLRTSR